MEIRGHQEKYIDQHGPSCFRPLGARPGEGSGGTTGGNGCLEPSLWLPVPSRVSLRTAWADWTRVGLDVNDGMLTMARAVATAWRRSNGWRGTAMRMPLPDAVFDAVAVSARLPVFSRTSWPCSTRCGVCWPQRAGLVLSSGASVAHARVPRPLKRPSPPHRGREGLPCPHSVWAMGSAPCVRDDAGFSGGAVRADVKLSRFPSAEPLSSVCGRPLDRPWLKALAAQGPDVSTHSGRGDRMRPQDYVDDEGGQRPRRTNIITAVA